MATHKPVSFTIVEPPEAVPRCRSGYAGRHHPRGTTARRSSGLGEPTPHPHSTLATPSSFCSQTEYRKKRISSLLISGARKSARPCRFNEASIAVHSTLPTTPTQASEHTRTHTHAARPRFTGTAGHEKDTVEVINKRAPNVPELRAGGAYQTGGERDTRLALEAAQRVVELLLQLLGPDRLGGCRKRPRERQQSVSRKMTRHRPCQAYPAPSA